MPEFNENVRTEDARSSVGTINEKLICQLFTVAESIQEHSAYLAGSSSEMANILIGLPDNVVAKEIEKPANDNGTMGELLNKLRRVQVNLARIEDTQMPIKNQLC